MVYLCHLLTHLRRLPVVMVRVCPAMFVCCLLDASPAVAQPYTVPVHAVANGGGSSGAGGGYALAGTIGQVDAGGPSTGGSYTLIGGFWGTVAAYTPFTDHTLTPGSSTIRAIHILELRSRIDALRVRFGLAAFAYAGASLTPGTSVILLQHLDDLRTALSQAYVASGRAALIFSESPAAGTTPIRAAHVAELRAAVIALE
jgi:hypothetical protein